MVTTKPISQILLSTFFVLKIPVENSGGQSQHFFCSFAPAHGNKNNRSCSPVFQHEYRSMTCYVMRSNKLNCLKPLGHPTIIYSKIFVIYTTHYCNDYLFLKASPPTKINNECCDATFIKSVFSCKKC